MKIKAFINTLLISASLSLISIASYERFVPTSTKEELSDMIRLSKAKNLTPEQRQVKENLAFMSALASPEEAAALYNMPIFLNSKTQGNPVSSNEMSIKLQRNREYALTEDFSDKPKNAMRAIFQESWGQEKIVAGQVYLDMNIRSVRFMSGAPENVKRDFIMFHEVSHYIAMVMDEGKRDTQVYEDYLKNNPSLKNLSEDQKLSFHSGYRESLGDVVATLLVLKKYPDLDTSFVVDLALERAAVAQDDPEHDTSAALWILKENLENAKKAQTLKEIFELANIYALAQLEVITKKEVGVSLNPNEARLVRRVLALRQASNPLSSTGLKGEGDYGSLHTKNQKSFQ